MTAANETQTLGSIRASETCISSQRASSCRGWENSDQVCPRPAAELRSAGHPRRLYPHWLVGKLISLFLLISATAGRRMRNRQAPDHQNPTWVCDYPWVWVGRERVYRCRIQGHGRPAL